MPARTDSSMNVNNDDDDDDDDNDNEVWAGKRLLDIINIEQAMEAELFQFILEIQHFSREPLPSGHPHKWNHYPAQLILNAHPPISLQSQAPSSSRGVLDIPGGQAYSQAPEFEGKANAVNSPSQTLPSTQPSIGRKRKREVELQECNEGEELEAEAKNDQDWREEEGDYDWLQDGAVEYLVKWKHYNNGQNSWIPESSVNCQQAIDEYWTASAEHNQDQHSGFHATKYIKKMKKPLKKKANKMYPSNGETAGSNTAEVESLQQVLSHLFGIQTTLDGSPTRLLPKLNSHNELIKPQVDTMDTYFNGGKKYSSNGDIIKS
ncbi:hypothetical protein DFH29DRAFT_997903 [Suillus ampliporus]|nr:hypothetical protein DFH29DRAFT_997903 [Suillus ampliporus]